MSATALSTSRRVACGEVQLTMTDAELIDRLRKRAARLARLADMLEAFQDEQRAEKFLSDARAREEASGKPGKWIPGSAEELRQDVRHAAGLQLNWGSDDSSSSIF
jgi:hypothetical protein